MKNKKIIIEALVMVCAIVAIIGGFFFAQNFGYMAYANEPAGEDDAHTLELVIEAGDSVMSIGEKLEEEGIILSKNAFWFRSKFSEYDGLMKAGTYTVKETMGIDDILAVITQSEAR